MWVTLGRVDEPSSRLPCRRLILCKSHHPSVPRFCHQPNVNLRILFFEGKSLKAIAEMHLSKHEQSQQTGASGRAELPHQHKLQHHCKTSTPTGELDQRQSHVPPTSFPIERSLEIVQRPQRLLLRASPRICVTHAACASLTSGSMWCCQGPFPSLRNLKVYCFVPHRCVEGIMPPS